MATAQVRVPEARIPEWMGFDGLVQLISVDGQRTVGCPYWELVADVDAAQLREPLPRHGGGAPSSTPRPWHCSDRASWRCGPRSSGRRPPRSGRPGRCVPTTSSSRATASTAWPTAGASIRCMMLRLWRGAGLSGLGPRHLRHRHAGHRRRFAAPARHRLRAGDHPRRRHLCGARPTSGTAPRARVTWPRPSASPPAT